MTKWIAGAALAALSAGAVAQAPPATPGAVTQAPPANTKWGFFTPEGGTLQAGVVAADGSQFILKCDKQGNRSVYAVVVAQTNLARVQSDDRFESFPVSVRMDGNPPYDDNWRFNDRFAMAVNKGNVRSLTRLLEKLHTADKMQIRLQPVLRGEVTINYDVTGARDAIERVFASCHDTLPFS
jgi:hypothetical protein